MFQPLDVSINKPYKDCMSAKWQNWMLAGQHSFSAGGRIHKVELDEICRWISDPWDDIPPEMIAKLFVNCCITNALDGTEDEEFVKRRPTKIHSKIWMKWTAMTSCIMQITLNDKKRKLTLNALRCFFVVSMQLLQL